MFHLIALVTLFVVVTKRIVKCTKHFKKRDMNKILEIIFMTRNMSVDDLIIVVKKLEK